MHVLTALQGTYHALCLYLIQVQSTAACALTALFVALLRSSNSCIDASSAFYKRELWYGVSRASVLDIGRRVGAKTPQIGGFIGSIDGYCVR